MNRKIHSPSRSVGFLWSMLLLYALARGCQVYADRLPVLMIVILHVVPPALFAVVHGSVTFGHRGMAVFSAICLGVGSCAELLSLRTGFPFGTYHFTAVMGPACILTACAVVSLSIMTPLAGLAFARAATPKRDGIRWAAQ